MIYVEQFLRCGWNPAKWSRFSNQLLASDKHKSVWVHSDTHQRPVSWPYTGMNGTQCLSWELTSWHSVLWLCVLCSAAKQRWRDSDTKQDCGWKWWGRAMMGGMTREDRKEENLGMWHRTETEAWEGGGRQSSRQRGWSVLFLCLGFKSLGTKLFPSQSLCSEIPKHLRGSRGRLDCDSRVQNRH